MLKISIPTPCHEDWDAMTPNTEGRHCISCAKTVVDFTNMSDEEVKYFFINKKEETVCGRFRNTQLQRITIALPQNIFHIQMPFWKQFLVASLLVFSATLFSCDTTTSGQVVRKNATEYTVTDYKIDTVSVNQVPLPPETSVGICVPSIIDTIESQIVSQGDIQIDLPPAPSVTLGTPAIIIKTHETINVDSTKIKNPPKADSIDCNTQIYY